MTVVQLRVVFVCLGNICRSPLAEGAFRSHVRQQNLEAHFDIASSGTSGYHVGEAPDPRSIAVAARHGVDISEQRSEKFVASDLEDFDYIIAMDRQNQIDINTLAPRRTHGEVSLLLDEVQDEVREVPDPYYGGAGGFDHVWTLVNGATRALLKRISAERL